MFYTGKGDDGTTQLYGKAGRFSKTDALFEALGTLDELNSYLGVCKVSCGEHVYVATIESKEVSLVTLIHDAQNTLFIIQAELAGADKHVEREKVAYSESVISTIEGLVPPLQSFIVAGGSHISAQLDVARAVSRRAERRVLEVHKNGSQRVHPHTLQYLNRFSSLLFALARFVEYTEGASREVPTYT
jgi:cob(I)alamin adenosyltransferase